MVTCQALDAAIKAICKATGVTPKHCFFGITRFNVFTALRSRRTLIPFNCFSFLFKLSEKFLGSICILEKFFCLGRCLSSGCWAPDWATPFIFRRGWADRSCGTLLRSLRRRRRRWHRLSLNRLFLRLLALRRRWDVMRLFLLQVLFEPFTNLFTKLIDAFVIRCFRRATRSIIWSGSVADWAGAAFACLKLLRTLAAITVSETWSVT